jgi:hypothetical protein
MILYNFFGCDRVYDIISSKKGYVQCLEKIKINLSNGPKKSSDEQLLKASRNWEKCSALAASFFLGVDICTDF